MKKVYSFFIATLFIAFASVAAAQTVTEEIIPVQPPQLISFKDLADYELTYPIPRVQRMIEQGEDKERGIRYQPQPITPGAVTFEVPAPQQQQRAVTNSPAPSVSFNGALDNGTLIPPDIRGAAGPGHVMQTTNQEFKIYTKTGTLLSTLSIVNFFASTGGSGYFDPHILYDPNYSRWVLCIAGTHSNGNGGVFIGVSQTSDPTGTWYVYSFDGIGNPNDFLDYPLMGYNANWVVITINDFLATNGVTGKIFVMNRASLYGGTLGTVTAYTDANVFSLAPAQTYDAAQTTLYMVQNWNGSSGGNGYVRVGKITGTATSPSYTAGTLLGINQPWSNSTIDAPQLGSTQKIDAGDSRVGNSVFINGSLWFCQTAFLPASGPTRAAVQWWQINPATPSLQQFGRVDAGSSSGIFYYYPGIAVNAANDVLLGHCQSSSGSYASASYSTRFASDASNTIQTPYNFKTGLASYYKTYGGTRNRWGDYTGASIDPSNGSFWNFNQWANTSNRWATAIANVTLTPPTPCDVPASLSTSAIGDNTATFNWGAVGGALSYNVQYRITGSATWTTANTTNAFYTASGLAAATNYEWQVQTVCSGATSSYTGSTTFTTTGTLPCNTPGSLSTSAITTTTATFNWGAVSGAVSYNVQYRVVGPASWSTGSSSTTSYNAVGLTASSNYEWQVETVCSAGSSGYSASSTFTTATATTCSDIYESNNGSGSAKTIPANTDLSGFINPSGDVDWFKFSTTSPNTRVKVNLTNLPADYDIVLYKSNARSVLRSSTNTGTTSEQMIYNNTSAATYYLRVYGYNGANSSTQCYKLRVSVSSTSWAPEYGAAEVSDNKAEVTDIAPLMNVYPNPAKDRITAEFFSNGGTVSVTIYNLYGQVVFSSNSSTTEGPNTQTINTSMFSKGVYVFEVEENGETQRRQFTIGY